MEEEALMKSFDNQAETCNGLSAPLVCDGINEEDEENASTFLL